MDNFDDINYAAENSGQTGYNLEPDSTTGEKTGWFDEIPEANAAENPNPPQPSPQPRHHEYFNQPYNQAAAQNGFNVPGGHQPGGYPQGGYSPGGHPPYGYQPGGHSPYGYQPGGHPPGGHPPYGYPNGFYQPGPYPNGGYSQGASYRPVPPPVAMPKRDTGLSIASFVLSIASIILIWVPVLNLILALTALILGTVSLVKGCGGLGIAGVVISSLTLMAALAISLLAGLFWASFITERPGLEYDFEIGWMMALLPSIFK